MRTLDILSISQLENLSNLLEYDDNVCSYIKIIYPYTDDKTPQPKKLNTNPSNARVFGYEDADNEIYGYENDILNPKDIISKGLIRFNPEKRFLKTIGILVDDKQTGVPISDNEIEYEDEEGGGFNLELTYDFCEIDKIREILAWT